MRGDRIKELRKKAGMTQQELADKLGYVSKVSISRIESGERDLSTDKLNQMALVLKTNAEYILGNSDNPYPVFRIVPGRTFDTPEEFNQAWKAAVQNIFDQKLIAAYHAAPDKDQTAVRVVLDIDENGDKRNGGL